MLSRGALLCGLFLLLLPSARSNRVGTDRSLETFLGSLERYANTVNDVVFLLDESGSIGTEMFLQEKLFFKLIAQRLSVSAEHSRVAVVTFATDTITHIDYIKNPYGNNMCTLLKSIDSIGYAAMGTQTDKAMKEAERILAQARPGSNEIIVLLTDGQSNAGHSPVAISYELKQKGTNIFAIGVAHVNVEEVNAVATSPNHLYILRDFDYLVQVNKYLVNDTRDVFMDLARDNSYCNGLCTANEYCCDENAACYCGTRTGRYECACHAGYMSKGGGVKGQCHKCPKGTYKSESRNAECTACPPHSTTAKEGSTSPSDCVCEPGYDRVGKKCEPVRCALLNAPEGGILIPTHCNNTYGSQCSLKCREGYCPISCEAYQALQAIKQRPSLPTRTCLDTKIWSGEEFHCEKMTCPDLHFPNNGMHNCSEKDFTFGSTCSYKCDKGYELSGSVSRTCLSNGWTGDDATCKAPCKPGTYSDTGYEPCTVCPNRTTTLTKGATRYEDCKEFDICAEPQPCRHNATCIQNDKDYECQCPEGLMGKHCEINLDDCASSPCLNNGTCVDGIANFTCTCPEGWIGRQCQTRRDECHPNPCLNGAQCVNKMNDYECICTPGFSGQRCEQNIDECESNPCQNNGTCLDMQNGYRCYCTKDFYGHNCENELIRNACNDVTCENGGTCNGNESTFNCTCPLGFEGQLCETNIDDCVGHTCENGGTCVDGIGEATCRCPQKYTGAHCETGLPQEYILSFPYPSTANYVKLENAYRLYAITVSFFMRTSFRDPNSRATPVSYSYRHNDHLVDNALSLLDTNSFVLYIHGTTIHTDHSGNSDADWHHYAITWEKMGGKWAFYVDGKIISSGENVGENTYMHPGTFVLGQEQDDVGSTFSVLEAFAGDITEFNVYDYAMTPDEVKKISMSCGYVGNVIPWYIVSQYKSGDVQLSNGVYKCKRGELFANTGDEDSITGSGDEDSVTGSGGILVTLDEGDSTKRGTDILSRLGHCPENSCDCYYTSQQNEFSCKNKVSACSNTTCANGQPCVSNTLGSFCSCGKGFEGRHCEYDIDECLDENGGCDYLCVNDVGTGSYHCECPDDLILSEDGKTCKDTGYCLQDDKTYLTGETWVDHCRHCICNGGIVECEAMKCNETSCPPEETMYTSPGECCPKCVAEMTCPALHIPKNGMYSCSEKDFTFGTTCTYICDKGYELSGSVSRTCQSDGWTGDDATCKEIFCNPLKTNSLLHVRPQRCSTGPVPYNTVCQYHCSHGYILAQNGNINKGMLICGLDKKWSGDYKDLSCEDNEEPKIKCPQSIQIDAEPHRGYALVEWELPVTTDNVPGSVPKVRLLYSKNMRKAPNYEKDKPSFFFPIGSTKVVYEATDPSNLSSTCSFRVVVFDKEAPQTVFCPSDIEKYHESSDYVPVEWEEPIFQDNSGKLRYVTASRKSGDKFGWGPAVTVIYEASDEAGNKANCTFQVKVKPYPCPFFPPPANGVVTCDKWLDGRICKIFCHDGYKFAVGRKFDTTYMCQQVQKPDGTFEGVWRAFKGSKVIKVPWPDCSRKQRPSSVNVTGDLTFDVDSCSEENLHKFRQKFLAIPVFHINAFCPKDNNRCSLENIHIECSPARVRRSIQYDTSDKNKRDAPKQVLTVSFNVQVDPSATNDISVNPTNDDIDLQSAPIIKQLEEKISLNVKEAFNVDTVPEPLVNLDVVVVCSVGQIIVNNTCVNCLAGTYKDDVSGTCIDCPLDTYQDEERQLSCKACPVGFTTHEVKSKSADDCKAKSMAMTSTIID